VVVHRREEARVHHVFVFEKVAVVVGPWWEPGDPPERGARVEVRLRAEEPHRGSESAAQRIVVDQPVFRADLFDTVDAPPGNLRAAHFHAGFDGVEPRDREWPLELRADPARWLAAELSDLSRILARAGVALGDGSRAADAGALRDAVPAILAAVGSTWDAVRADPPADPVAAAR
jgi:hypothetical protein